MLNKIAFIGAGDVGSQTAFLVAQQQPQLTKEIVLVDILANFAAGRALDINHSLGKFGNDIKVTGTDNFIQIADSDLIIITAGKSLPKDQPEYSRDRLFSDNIKIFTDIFAQIAHHAPQSIVVIVTNPVDALTTWVHRNTAISHNQIIGFGNSLDSLRYQYYGNNTTDMVIGEHGDDMVLVAQETQDIRERVIAGATSVIELLGNRSTMFAPAIGLRQLIQAIANDERIVLPVSTLLDGQFDITGVSLGWPCLIGRDGIISKEESPSSLEPFEIAKLQAAAQKINRELELVNTIID